MVDHGTRHTVPSGTPVITYIEWPVWTFRKDDPTKSIYIYIYICMYTVYIYICVYIHTYVL